MTRLFIPSLSLMEEAALTPDAVDVGGAGWREVVAEAEETLAFLEGAF